MLEPVDATLLRQWETTRQPTLPRRTAALIALGWPQLGADASAALPVGQANLRLLQLRERSFGHHMAGVADCPACGEPLEFSVDTRMLAATASAGDAQPREIEHEACRAVVQPPTLADCMAAAEAADAATAYRVLFDRCVSATSADGMPLAALPPALEQLIDQAFEAADAAAEWRLGLDCPACGQHSEAVLDMAAFYGAEIDVHAPRLLAEVHLLASRYGWPEADILAMSRLRRDHYLQLVQS